MSCLSNNEEEARRYSSIKYSLSVAEWCYALALLAVFLFSGLSALLVKAAYSISSSGWLAMPVYLLLVFFLYYILNFPLNFYRTLLLEHQFKLSRQSMKDWFLDQLKAGVISYFISVVILEVFYLLLSRQPEHWWWIISLFWIFLSLVLAKLAPVLIIPLFFKYKKYSDENIRRRIIKLAGKMDVKILDVFEIDLSRKTAKGNAALVGFGNTRRVILGDTLKDKYSADEIEVVLAHEFAHQKLGHLFKLVLSGVITTVVCMFAIYKTSPYVLGFFHLQSLSQTAAMPVVFIYLLLAGALFQPWENFLSRRFERQADKLAIQSTGLKDAFVSTMEKLSGQNLSDRSPHPVIKFFFFDHPAIDERIRSARSF